MTHWCKSDFSYCSFTEYNLLQGTIYICFCLLFFRCHLSKDRNCLFSHLCIPKIKLSLVFLPAHDHIDKMVGIPEYLTVQRRILLEHFFPFCDTDWYTWVCEVPLMESTIFLNVHFIILQGLPQMFTYKMQVTFLHSKGNNQ